MQKRYELRSRLKTHQKSPKESKSLKKISKSHQKSRKISKSVFFIAVSASIAMISICGVVWLLGIIGNSALIFTYKRKGLDVRFNQLMVTLAVFDIIFLVTTPILPHALRLVGNVTRNETNPEFVYHPSGSGLVFWNSVYILNALAFKGSIFTTIGNDQF